MFVLGFFVCVGGGLLIICGFVWENCYIKSVRWYGLVIIVSRL